MASNGGGQWHRAFRWPQSQENAGHQQGTQPEQRSQTSQSNNDSNSSNSGSTSREGQSVGGEFPQNSTSPPPPPPPPSSGQSSQGDFSDRSGIFFINYSFNLPGVVDFLSGMNERGRDGAASQSHQQGQPLNSSGNDGSNQSQQHPTWQNFIPGGAFIYRTPVDIRSPGDVPKPRASQRAIDKLKRLSLQDVPVTERECPICFDALEDIDIETIQDKDDSEVSDPPVSIPMDDDPPESAPDGDDLKEGDSKNDHQQHCAVQMPCHHIFGCCCIKEWLSTNNTCPLCRTALESHNEYLRATGQPPEYSSINGSGAGLFDLIFSYMPNMMRSQDESERQNSAEVNGLNDSNDNLQRPTPESSTPASELASASASILSSSAAAASAASAVAASAVASAASSSTSSAVAPPSVPPSAPPSVPPSAPSSALPSAPPSASASASASTPSSAVSTPSADFVNDPFQVRFTSFRTFRGRNDIWIGRNPNESIQNLQRNSQESTPSPIPGPVPGPDNFSTQTRNGNSSPAVFVSIRRDTRHHPYRSSTRSPVENSNNPNTSNLNQNIRRFGDSFGDVNGRRDLQCASLPLALCVGPGTNDYDENSGHEANRLVRLACGHGYHVSCLRMCMRAHGDNDIPNLSQDNLGEGVQRSVWCTRCRRYQDINS